MPNRKEHIFENEIEKKHCYSCDTYKVLSDFTKQSNAWDKLNRMCRSCFNEYKQNKRKNDPKYKEKDKIFTEEYKKSGRRREKDQARYEEKKEEIIEKQVKYNKKKYNEDPAYRLVSLHRRRVSKMIEDLKMNKNVAYKDSKLELLGCSPQELKEWIENQFTEGMSWDKLGIHGIHIDHIRPCASFDLSIEENVSKCFHYSNLQPLWAKDNLSKSSKF
tara:strand:+ start:250 stop:903 length:654 start_codon:yes stop_codon:yes gene_type:complete